MSNRCVQRNAAERMTEYFSVPWRMTNSDGIHYSATFTDCVLDYLGLPGERVYTSSDAQNLLTATTFPDIRRRQRPLLDRGLRYERALRLT